MKKVATKGNSLDEPTQWVGMDGEGILYHISEAESDTPTRVIGREDAVCLLIDWGYRDADRVLRAGQIQGEIIVTRHPALVEYLLEIQLVPPGTEILSHATAEDLRGRHVYGVLPPSLAVHAVRVTEIPLRLPAHLRGVELSLEQIRECAGTPWTYEVREVREVSSHG